MGRCTGHPSGGSQSCCRYHPTHISYIGRSLTSGELIWLNGTCRGYLQVGIPQCFMNLICKCFFFSCILHTTDCDQIIIHNSLCYIIGQYRTVSMDDLIFQASPSTQRRSFSRLNDPGPEILKNIYIKVPNVIKNFCIIRDNIGGIPTAGNHIMDS